MKKYLIGSVLFPHLKREDKEGQRVRILKDSDDKGACFRPGEQPLQMHEGTR